MSRDLSSPLPTSERRLTRDLHDPYLFFYPLIFYPFNSCIPSDPRDFLLILMHRKQSNHRGISFGLPARYILAFALRPTIRHHAGRLSRNRERHIEEALEGTIFRRDIACRQQIQRVIGRDHPELQWRFLHIIIVIGPAEVAPLLHLHMSPSSADFMFFLRKPFTRSRTGCFPGGRVYCTCKTWGADLSPNCLPSICSGLHLCLFVLSG